MYLEVGARFLTGPILTLSRMRVDLEIISFECPALKASGVFQLFYCLRIKNSPPKAILEFPIPFFIFVNTYLSDTFCNQMATNGTKKNQKKKGVETFDTILIWWSDYRQIKKTAPKEFLYTFLCMKQWYYSIKFDVKFQHKCMGS